MVISIKFKYLSDKTQSFPCVYGANIHLRVIIKFTDDHLNLGKMISTEPIISKYKNQYSKHFLQNENIFYVNGSYE